MLQFGLRLFYNSQEYRLRCIWRLLFQLLILMAIFTGSGLLFYTVNLFLPLPDNFITNPIFGFILALFSVLGSLKLASRWLDRRPFIDYGFHFNQRWWFDFSFGLVLGMVLMAIIFLIELASGWITITQTLLNRGSGTTFWVEMALGFLYFLAVGIYEEAFSRGYQLRNLAEGFRHSRLDPRLSLMIGYFLSSIIFGFLHVGNPNANAISTINIVLAGLFLGFGFILTGELAIPIGLHFTWNFFQGYVFGFPVSGTGTRATLIAIQQDGPTLLTGGAFGPEAGLIGLLAILLGFLLTYIWIKKFHGKVKLEKRLAEYR